MIKRFLAALSVSTALSTPAFAETLSDTVTQALQSHPQIKESVASVAAATKGVSEEKSGWFPVLSLDGEAGRVHNDDDTTRGYTPSRGASAGWKNQGSVTLTQPLFTGFAVENRVDSAKNRYEAATHDLTGAAEDVTLRAARAHLNLMRTRELLDIASEYQNNIETRRKNISLQVKGGAADEAELLQAEEIAVAAKNTRLGYEEAYRQAEADYIEVAGNAPAKQLEFGDKTWNALLPKTLDDAVSYATTKNARVLAAGNMVAAAGNDADAEQSGLLPHVNAEVNYLKSSQRHELGGDTEDASAMLRLGWNFELGGGQVARIDKMREEQNAALAKRQQVIRTVEHDTRQKFTSMQIVDQQYALLTDRERAAENILKNFLAQYEGGKQTNLQLIGAHTKVFESKTALTDAYYRQLLARFELLSAMGRLREAFTLQASQQPAAAPPAGKG